MVCPPVFPIFRVRSVDGSLPLLVRNGPLAWIRTGSSRDPLPFSCKVASTFRFALWMSERNALSSRFSTSPLLPEFPQETRASAANSAIRTRRRTRRRVLGPTATPRRCRRWRKDADRTSPDPARDAGRGARGSSLRPRRERDRGDRRPRRAALRPHGPAGVRHRPAAPTGPVRASTRATASAAASGGPRARRSTASGRRAVTACPQASRAGEEDQARRLPALDAAMGPGPPHAAPAARRAQGPALLRVRLGREPRAHRAADPLAHAGGLPPGGAQPPVLAQAPVPGERGPRDLPRQPDRVRVLPRARAPDPSAVHASRRRT